MIRTRRALGAITLVSLGAACGSATTGGQVVSEEPPRSLAEPAPADQDSQAWEPGAWTSRFRAPAALIAEEVFISGPRGLLDHVVSADAPETTYLVKTTPDGLLQERTAQPGVEFVKIQTQVDQWKIVGTQKVVILERPGRVHVVVEVRGNAYYNDDELASPDQGERFRFVGEIGG